MQRSHSTDSIAFHIDIKTFKNKKVVERHIVLRQIYSEKRVPNIITIDHVLQKVLQNNFGAFL